MSLDNNTSENESDLDSIELLYKTSIESSIDVPVEEWSSLIIEEKNMTVKEKLNAQGLYEPGSGEICAKYIPMSDSDVLRHCYYKYPAILDPGIEGALFGPLPDIEYPNDGQNKYLALCEEMSIPVIRSFYKSLLTSKVDLCYYGLSSKAIRAIFSALKYNEYVEVIDLTGNWLDRDACFHLGDELTKANNKIKTLILNKCMIGPDGAHTLFHYLSLHCITKIDLASNQLGDEGIKHITQSIFRGLLVQEFNFSNNYLTQKSLPYLIEAFGMFYTLTYLNLSWNCLFAPALILKLCEQLAEHSNFKVLDLSWNALRDTVCGDAMKTLFGNVKMIESVILNNNRLEGEAIKIIGNGLTRAKNLVTLDLSNNPLTTKDALLLLEHLRKPQVKLRCLLLENVIVDESFVKVRQEIMSLPFRKDVVITHGRVQPTMVYHPADMRRLLLKRAEFVARSGNKRDQKDFPLIILELFREDPTPKPVKRFSRNLETFGLKLDEDWHNELAIAFPGPRTEKDNLRTINLETVVEYIKRLWPRKKLPPLPPPFPVIQAPLPLKVKPRARK